MEPLYKVGDHVEYDMEEYEIIAVSKNTMWWWEHNIQIVPQTLFFIDEEELEER